MKMLKDLLQLSCVPRWTTHPMLKSQSVAEHSFNVAALANYIAGCCGCGEHERNHIAWLALVHDAPEAKVGDMPSTVKQFFGRDAIHEVERKLCPYMADHQPTDPLGMIILEIADQLDALYFVRRYGQGAKDHFDGEYVASKLYKRIFGLITSTRQRYPELYNTVYNLLRED